MSRQRFKWAVGVFALLLLIGLLMACQPSSPSMSATPEISPSSTAESTRTVRTTWTPSVTPTEDILGAIHLQSTETRIAYEGQKTQTAIAYHTQSAVSTVASNSDVALLPGIVTSLISSYEPLDFDAGPLFGESIPPLSNDQILDAKRCTLNDPLTADPQTACAWATLADAIAQYGAGDPQTQELGRQSYARAVQLNPAFALKGRLYFEYFGAVALTADPPAASRTIVTIASSYANQRYQDTGPTTEWIVAQADSEPTLYGVVTEKIEIDPERRMYGHPSWKNVRTFDGTVSVDAVQSLRAGLTDLVPISSLDPYYVSVPRCVGAPDPSWNLMLIMDDGESIFATQLGSYVLGGGPWMFTIGDQRYLQASPAFTQAVSALAVETGLVDGPLSLETTRTAKCETYYGADDMLNEAFPAGGN